MDELRYADYCKNHILNDIMPFWDKRCIDKEYGGYFTCFDREGNLTDDKKYIWFQARQLYVYSLLYNRIEQRAEWLDMAKHGLKFLLEKAYAGKGRWNYRLTREGKVLVGTTSIYADFHAIQGLAEYLHAVNNDDEECLRVLNESYDTLEVNMFDPYFKDIYENTWDERYIWHDMYMTCLSAVVPCIPVLGPHRTEKLLNECLEKICNWFARDEEQVVFEAVTRDNKVDMSTPLSRFVNPGHMMESAWFMLYICESLNYSKIKERALQISDWAYQIGHDFEMGGMFSYADASRIEPVAVDWFKETNSLWDDKVWWTNAEALCGFALSYEKSGEKRYYERFVDQIEYCRNHFYDEQYGEWYERLWRDGSIKNPAKGTEWKCAFHLVRALVFVQEALGKMA
ncbi:MAG: AGE family epimerase/isomerase [Peptococcales bacterium]|jgi:N-acylglucosamine 2-epimerase